MALHAEALRAAEAAGAGLGGGAGTAGPWSSGMAAAAHAGVPPVVLWSDDDRRMKQELVAWARAVASMVVRDYSIRC
ncbi:uncharacterized protein C2845_PM16G09390 [Panicum miliaceum]|uniref:Uncharacterized protein n=1 Tax=Panicum miliaceum TaxID=4540 RepID=A0A3L6Q1C4_PANMI|nr:uncharacterized protein C2845_PM16G09390 [Panicum miliaceum]